MKTKLERLRDEALGFAKDAREIAEKAESEGRPLTSSEKARFDSAMTNGRSAADALKAARVDQQVLDQAKALADAIGPLGPGLGSLAGVSRADARKAWAADTAAEMKAIRNASGSKSFVSGSITGANPIVPGVAELGRAPASVLDLLQVVPAASDGSNAGATFSFLQQTVRAFAAAPVADLGTKPTSTLTIAEVVSTFQVIAHITQQVPLRYFADDHSLEQFLADELAYGLQLATETEVVSGDGTGAHLTGLLHTSGVVSQAFDTDLFVSIRKAITGQESSGNIPTGIAMNPGDVEVIDLAQDNNDRYYGNGPFSGGPRTLWGLPIVSSNAIPEGEAIVGDWTLASLVVREGATLATDTGGDNFAVNAAVLRLEGRFGFAVRRPSAFALVDLTA